MKKNDELIFTSKVKFKMYFLLTIALGLSFFIITYFTDALDAYDWSVIGVYLTLFIYVIYMLKQIKVYKTKLVFKYFFRPKQKIINFIDIASYTYQPVKVSGIKMKLLKLQLNNNETITIASLIYSEVDLIVKELEEFYKNK